MICITILLQVDRHDEALQDITTSLDLNPTSFKALRTRARIHMHFEKFDAAIADFNSALELADNSAEQKSIQAELRKAEAALKRSKTKDYYKILGKISFYNVVMPILLTLVEIGIARDCSEIDIKKAYRRESLKHHPDKGGDEEKFKLVVEAHTVLSDPTRRERYDMGVDEDGSMDSSGGGFGRGGFGGGIDPDVAQFFFGGGFGGGGGFRFSHGGPGQSFPF